MVLKLSKTQIFILLILVTIGIIFIILNQGLFNPLIGLSVISVLMLGIICSFFKINFLFSLLILFIPFSININIAGTESNIMFPSEPLTAVLTVAVLSKLIFFSEFSVKFIKHPLTCLIIIYFSLLAVSACFSNLPIVSLKFLLVRFCYILVFYFLTHLFIKNSIINGIKIYLYYCYALVPIIIYALYRHSLFHFEKTDSPFMSEPFFNDHTIYSACLAFVLPAITASFLFSDKLGLSLFKKTASFFLMSLFCIAIFFSYSRAAWISIIVSLLFVLILMLKIRGRFILFIFIILGAIAIENKDSIIDSFNLNTSDSNVRNADAEQVAKSITNVSNDISNAERLNRWSCAVRMTESKPLFGFGPGTYQFNYLSFQLASEMTRISVHSSYNVEKGRGGTAHSEYLLLLSESGIFTFISFLGIILTAVYTGAKIFYNTKNVQLKIVTASALLGLVSYVTHGIFNNFLDTDKAAFLFWSSLSVITTLDLYRIQTGKPKEV